ncbi:MAG: Wzz/FepE/Etk N-terminal domain-containing protein [Pyrinomonadaceae bacterium]|nr:Wzz/FepE/Etk N-terminal domain-containing protein [Pyrinomonadaceae bacterium]
MRNSQNSFIFQIFQSVFSHKLLILGILLSVVFSGMLVTFLITPKYEASMSIMISRDKVENSITPGDAGAGMVLPGISDEEFNSELEFLRSNEVISGAVREIFNTKYTPTSETGTVAKFRKSVKGKINELLGKKEESVDMRTLSEADVKKALEAEADRVASNLEVVPAKKSRVIKVTYRDIDPVRAKLVLENIYKKYAELHIQIAEKPQVTEVFNKQTEDYNAKLNSSTEAIKNFDSRNGISGSEIKVQREMLLKQYYDVQSQLNQTRTEITETNEKVAAFQKQIDEQPEQIQTGSVTKYVGAIDQMKSELLKLQQERTQLMQKYKPESRFVKDINERIAQVQKSLEAEQKAPPQEKSYAVNDLKRRLISDLYNAKSSLAALRQRETNLAGTMDKYRSDIESMNLKSIEREKLERNAAINEEAYVLYQKKARESEIGQTLQKNQLLNFTLIDPPFAGSGAVNPKPILNFIALSAVGLFVGIFCAIFVDKASEEMAEDFILSQRQLESRYDIPVLAVVPEMKLIESSESKRTIKLKSFKNLLKKTS